MSRVFISYVWEDDVKIWVKEFADRLKLDGIDVRLDQNDLVPGDRLPKFMEEQITSSDYVLIICTPAYKKKANKRTGGAGYEGNIISAELMNCSNERKFIPVMRKGTFKNAIPTFLAGKLFVDLSGNGNQYETSYQDLINTIRGERNETNNKPKSAITAVSEPRKLLDEVEKEPVRILGIITDEVTAPTMDGTPGCALYKIPFRLSRKPSDLWCEIFLQKWEMPSCFTSMHRPEIASVHEDKIILDGTTIEEVEKYHRDTLILCVKETNEREQELIEKQKRLAELKEQRKKQHFSKVAQIAESLQF